LALIETHTKILTCVAGNNDGSISVSASGGWPGGYEFEVKDGASFRPYSDVKVYTNLTAGFILSMVETAKDVDTKTVALVVPTLIAVTVTPATQLLSCYGDTKWNNRGNISKRWSRNKLFVHLKLFVSYSCSFFRTSSRSYFHRIRSRVYSITVTDGWGCGIESTQ
jgi:hypothetical protein